MESNEAKDLLQRIDADDRSARLGLRSRQIVFTVWWMLCVYCMVMRWWIAVFGICILGVVVLLWLSRRRGVKPSIRQPIEQSQTSARMLSVFCIVFPGAFVSAIPAIWWAAGLWTLLWGAVLIYAMRRDPWLMWQ